MSDMIKCVAVHNVVLMTADGTVSAKPGKGLLLTDKTHKELLAGGAVRAPKEDKDGNVEKVSVAFTEGKPGTKSEASAAAAASEPATKPEPTAGKTSAPKGKAAPAKAAPAKVDEGSDDSTDDDV